VQTYLNIAGERAVCFSVAAVAYPQTLPAPPKPESWRPGGFVLTRIETRELPLTGSVVGVFGWARELRQTSGTWSFGHLSPVVVRR
jgi:hypothetical protein